VKKDKELYMDYLRALRNFNLKLEKIASLLLPGVKLSSYVARHTWATLAFHAGMSIGIISKALGHFSIKVTETYLKPFENEKVDAVGACVGMRGNRVRNIVNELQGEKIDIVRFNDDVREYIKAALSPAKVSEIKLDRDTLKAEVIVDDDQLSLSIGKHGQNVRLASRLVGWELDIRTKSMIAAEALGGKAETATVAAEEAGVEAQEPGKEKKTKKAQVKKAPKKAAKAEAKKEVKKEAKKEIKKEASLGELLGLGDKIAESLKNAGVKNISDIIKLDLQGLMEIKGIGEKKAQKIIAEAKKLL
jgi:predicted flap endonuclease-1-like 5' DNA nuclease